MKYKIILLLFCFAVLLTACGKKEKVKINEADVIHQNVNQLTKLIIYDVFSPPVASRIYAYTSLAAYETVRFEKPEEYKSLAPLLNHFGKIPEPEKNKEYDFTLAATKAFFTVARKMTFSVDSFLNHENRIYGAFKENLDDSVYARSVAFGDAVAAVILKRSATDNYAKSRSKPKFLGSNEPGKWRPTPPDYFDGVEYCWGEMSAFVIDSSEQFTPSPPPSYSEDTSSIFFKANMHVYNTAKSLSKEQQDIAKYWDDNPFVMQHAGHMMFANKKITPGGHWIGITEIACKKVNADEVRSAQAYALTSMAIFDSFICCWEEKYRANVIRPVSVINEKIDPDWMPYLQTPPFPEFPSGHSSITRAAATILTHLFGDNFSFLDTSDLEYIGMQREFKSFIQAADEASISRVYGGIHYLHSVNAGAEQGKNIGNYMISKLKL